jgi:hypothetical protein
MLEPPYNVAACHTAGGRLSYLGERAVCVLVNELTDETEYFALGTGEKVTGFAPPPGVPTWAIAVVGGLLGLIAWTSMRRSR